MTGITILAPPVISVSASTVSPGGNTIECQIDETLVMVEVSTIGIQGPKGNSAVSKKSEHLTGVIDGINTTFFTTNSFIAGSATVSVNGLIQTTDDYIEFPNEKKIEFLSPPSNNVFIDVLFIHYLY